MTVKAYNILELIDTLGEENVKILISDFSCPKNKEIELFLYKKAIDFAKRHISVTYFVLDEAMTNFIGYFTLTHKAISVPVSSVSNSFAKRLKNYARYDEATNCFEVSAFLIAQFGKNFSVPNTFAGNEIMDAALLILRNVQRQIGGSAVFLECEDEEKLLSFYQNEHNQFRLYGDRLSAENIEYHQLIRLL